MANRESILEWLRSKRYRVVRENDPAYRIVCRPIAEGRAEWLSPLRVRAKDGTTT